MGQGIPFLALLPFLFVAGVRIAIGDIEYPSTPQIEKDGTAVLLEDYAVLPLSGRGGSITNFGPNVDLSNQLARPTFLRSEPAAAPLSSERFFVCDMNRNLYILGKSNRICTAYLNFQSIFPRFTDTPGYAAGLNPVQFDPGYATNGIFYTVHLESLGGGEAPINDNLPGLDLTGFTTTSPIDPPSGIVQRRSVLIEWTDTNITNSTFEGTAREILRIGLNHWIHPVGDLLFNPLAQPGDPDYGNLYVAVGDGRSGEATETRTTPQRLDALPGKILRITPDITLRPADELGANGRYRIPTTGPDPNPFVSVVLAGLKKEIFAYGMRNGHRLCWDPVSDQLIELEIGLNAWEEVNLIHKGLNYGYSEREGPEQLFIGGSNNGETGSQVNPHKPFPNPDELVVDGLGSPVVPTYPVAAYSHQDGDAISSGFVYRGSLMPALYGKFIFGDLTTGRIFYCDFSEMLAADDGDRNTLAPIHEIQIVHEGRKRRLFDIVSEQYHARGGTAGNALPGGAPITGGNDPDGVPYGGGRADVRLARGGDGEIYVLSKSDGTIRRMSSVLMPPTITSVAVTNGQVMLSWPSISNQTYRVQYKSSLDETEWTDLGSDVTAAGLKTSKTDPLTNQARLYRLMVMP